MSRVRSPSPAPTCNVNQFKRFDGSTGFDSGVSGEASEVSVCGWCANPASIRSSTRAAFPAREPHHARILRRDRPRRPPTLRTDKARLVNGEVAPVVLARHAGPDAVAVWPGLVRMLVTHPAVGALPACRHHAPYRASLRVDTGLRFALAPFESSHI